MHRSEVIEKMEMHPVIIAHVVDEGERGLDNEEILGVFVTMEQVLERLQRATQRRYNRINENSSVRVYTVYLNDIETLPMYYNYGIRWVDGTPVELYKEVI